MQTKHQEGMSAFQRRHLDGPSFESYENIYCPMCEEEQEMAVVGWRQDRYYSATCPVCDMGLTVYPDDEYNGSGEDG